MSYEWLDTVGTLPRVISEARKLVGTKEVAGKGDNPTIMAWASELGVSALGYKYTGDDVPWCGLFTAIVCKRAGKDIPTGPLYALNWKSVGVPQTQAWLGDILVFKREGGGHVGFYIGEDDQYYCVLGGNQSDSVSFTWIAKNRCVGIRRPKFNTALPASAKPYRLKRSGAISVNER